MTTFD